MRTLEFMRHHRTRIKAKRIVGDVTPKELGVRKHFSSKTFQELKQDEYCLVEDFHSGIGSLAD